MASVCQVWTRIRSVQGVLFLCMRRGARCFPPVGSCVSVCLSVCLSLLNAFEGLVFPIALFMECLGTETRHGTRWPPAPHSPAKVYTCLVELYMHVHVW